MHQHHFYDLEPIHEQEAEFGEFDFSESQEHETYRRYVDDVEQAEVAKFYYSKFYLYIALVKQNNKFSNSQVNLETLLLIKNSSLILLEKK